MKRFVYIVLVCFIAITATAQKTTEKDLQGKWKMTFFSADEISIDIPTEKVTIAPEMEKSLSPAYKEQMELEMLKAIEMLREAYATFEGTAFTQTMGPQDFKGALLIKDGKPYVSIPDNGNGETVELEAAVIDKKLHLTKASANENIHLIYVKQ